MINQTVMIDISHVCPHKCIYCLHQKNDMSDNKIMSYEVFSKITGILSDERYKNICLYMSGEPFCNTDIYDILNLCHYKNFNIEIASKFAVPVAFGKIKSDTIKFILSIDSIDQSIQNNISKVDILQQKMNIIYLIALEWNVKAYTIVNKFNENHLTDIADFCKLHNIPWSSKQMGYYFTRSQKIECENILPKNPKYRKRFINRMRICKSFLKPVIDINGDITICCHDMLHEVKAGNILQTKSLNTILNSDIYKKLQNDGKSMKLPICKGCN